MPKGVFTPEVPTDNDIVMGECILYADYGEASQVVIGATRDGSKYDEERVIRKMPFDGAYGPVKGLRRYERRVPRLTVNFLKLSYGSLYGFPGLTVTDRGNYHEIAFDLEIADADYLINIAAVGQKLDGKGVIIIIHNPLNDGNLSLDFKEKDEVVGEQQFTGHYAAATPTVCPVEIYDYD